MNEIVLRSVLLMYLRISQSIPTMQIAVQINMDVVPTEIRQANEGDLAVLASNNIAMALETENLELDPPTITQGVAAILADSSKGRYYVCTDANRNVIGQLMITLEWSDWRNANVWWIQSVYVHPQHRRRGIYRSLYARARHDAQQAGAAGLRLYADNDNTRAHATVRPLYAVSQCQRPLAVQVHGHDQPLHRL